MSEPHFVFLLRTPGFCLGEFALMALFSVTPPPSQVCTTSSSISSRHRTSVDQASLHPSLLAFCLFAIYICWSEPHLSEARDCLQSLIPRGAGKALGGVSVYPVETQGLEQAGGWGLCGCTLSCIWSFWEESWRTVQFGTRPGRRRLAWENPVDQLLSFH